MYSKEYVYNVLLYIYNRTWVDTPRIDIGRIELNSKQLQSKQVEEGISGLVNSLKG